jgi:ubiquinone/menaquinone biosynthesis C-methylase UbiE
MEQLTDCFTKKIMQNKFLLKLYAWAEPVCRLIDPTAKSVLDVGCGPSWPMKLLRQKFQYQKVVGVDLYEPYIAKARAEGIHDEYIIGDVRKLNLPDKSFDVVICLQVIEHLEKADALEMIKNLERIAKKQVILATPIGEMYHPDEDGNELQLHKCFFVPEDLQALGYQTIKFGRKSLYGETGLVHKIKIQPFRALIYFFGILATPLFLKFQSLSDYHVYAIKKIQ